MTNNWITRVTGKVVAEAAPARKLSSLRKVLGEAGEEQDDKPDKEDKPDKAEPDKAKGSDQEPLPAPATDEPEPKAAVDADIEAGAEASADSHVDSQAVQSLVSSWESGSKMDVASQLMYTPVSYADFVKMLFRIGEEDGVELGMMLDELSEVRPSIDQPGGQGDVPALGGGGGGGGGGAERILSRIAQRRQNDMPVAEPAGETGPELDSVP